MLRIVQVVVMLAIAILFNGSAEGFNELGHYIIAKNAYDQLSQAQQRAICDVLKSHPHYAEYLAANVPQGVSVEEWAFLRAATWSDWVRRNHSGDYHKSEWHYINYPYRPHAAPLSALPTALPQERNILERLPLTVKVGGGSAANELDLLSSLSPDQRRAVGLCWMFHLIGDLHQPLHVIALIDDVRFPAATHGDRGGNELAVVVSGTRPIRLHSYWDGALGYDASYGNAVAIASALRDNPPLPASQVASLAAQADFTAWALESYQLAVKYVYLDGSLPIVAWKPAFNELNAVADSDVPLLKETVQEDARKISKQRLYLAGVRLANQLKKIFP
jgi:hypothetical protein